MDRVIRARVLDKKGRSLPDANVKVFLGGNYFGEASAASSNAGTVYTFQINDSTVDVALRAEYNGQVPQDARLSTEVNEWDFVFPVEITVPRDKPFWEEHFAGLLGVAFIVLLATIALVLKKEPTQLQYRVLIGILAIGLAGVGTELRGFLHVELSLGKQLAVTAA